MSTSLEVRCSCSWTGALLVVAGAGPRNIVLLESCKEGGRSRGEVLWFIGGPKMN